MTRSRRGLGGATLLALMALVAAPSWPAASAGASTRPMPVARLTGPEMRRGCHGGAESSALLAVTVAGDLDAVNPHSGRTTKLASGIRPEGDVAVRPELDVAYVTAAGPGGVTAVWSIPLARCDASATRVEPDAELPAVSPDGRRLGYVSLNHRGQQTGVAVVRLGTRGRPEGAIRSYASRSVPPPLPITSVAVGRDDASLAVWGGAIDPYLGKSHPTVGTLTPAAAASLRSLVPVFDEAGISIPDEPRSGKQSRPEDWQSSPAYLPNGFLLVGDHNSGIVLPYTSGPNGGGIRSIVKATGPLRSLAAGPKDALAWVESDGRLVLSADAIDLPFGPGADTPPRTSAAPRRVVSGRFTSVTWTVGPTAESTPIPVVFGGVSHLPNVVGRSISDARSMMTGLDLPVLVRSSVADTSAPGTVLAQDPPAGDGVLCQCVVVLTVAAT